SHHSRASDSTSKPILCQKHIRSPRTDPRRRRERAFLTQPDTRRLREAGLRCRRNPPPEDHLLLPQGPLWSLHPPTEPRGIRRRGGVNSSLSTGRVHSL